MTIQRAFEIIKDEMPYESGVINEALNMVENAVEKQTSKKPIEKEIIGASATGYKYKGRCPKCSSTVSQYTGNYCPNCGQAIDWGEVEK
jgi:uncharacterized OB-fold protein